jgi:hypothetical protein
MQKLLVSHILESLLAKGWRELDAISEVQEKPRPKNLQTT